MRPVVEDDSGSDSAERAYAAAAAQRAQATPRPVTPVERGGLPQPEADGDQAAVTPAVADPSAADTPEAAIANLAASLAAKAAARPRPATPPVKARPAPAQTGSDPAAARSPSTTPTPSSQHPEEHTVTDKPIEKKTHETADKAREAVAKSDAKIQETSGKAVDAFQGAADRADGKATEAADKGHETVSKAEDKGHKAVSETEDKAHKAVAKAKDADKKVHGKAEAVVSKAASKAQDTITKAEGSAVKAETKVKKAADDLGTKVQDKVKEAQAYAKATFDKNKDRLSDVGEFTKGNIEAIREAGKILASGIRGMGKTYVEQTKSNFGVLRADVQELRGVKSPTEFVKLQTTMVRKYVDSAKATSSKQTEAMRKLAGAAFQPISHRVSVARDKFKKAA